MRFNLKCFPIYVGLLGVVISSETFAIELSDVEARPLEQTGFSGRNWVQMPINVQAKVQGSEVFRQRYPEEYLLGFWTNRKTRTNLLITDKINRSSTPVLDFSTMSAEDVEKSDQELYQNLLNLFKSQIPAEHQGRLQLHFAKSIHLKQGNYCYQAYYSSPGSRGETVHDTEIICKSSAKYLRLKLNQYTNPLSESQRRDLQSLAKYYLGG